MPVVMGGQLMSPPARRMNPVHQVPLTAEHIMRMPPLLRDLTVAPADMLMQPDLKRGAGQLVARVPPAHHRHLRIQVDHQPLGPGRGTRLHPYRHVIPSVTDAPWSAAQRQYPTPYPRTAKHPSACT